MFVLLLLTSFVVTSARGLHIEDCGSSLGNFRVVSVSACDIQTMDYCPLKRGTNASIAITFTANQKVVDIDVKVHGIIGGVPVPFSLPNPNGCVDSGVTCPLEPNQEETYSTTLPVLRSYPKISVTVKWELQNEESADIICFLLPAKIV